MSEHERVFILISQACARCRLSWLKLSHHLAERLSLLPEGVLSFGNCLCSPEQAHLSECSCHVASLPNNKRAESSTQAHHVHVSSWFANPHKNARSALRTCLSNRQACRIKVRHDAARQSARDGQMTSSLKRTRLAHAPAKSQARPLLKTLSPVRACLRARHGAHGCQSAHVSKLVSCAPRTCQPKDLRHCSTVLAVSAARLPNDMPVRLRRQHAHCSNDFCVKLPSK